MKGVGGLTEQEYCDMINTPKIDVIKMDEKGQESLEMAFGDEVEGRKKWLM